MLIPVIRTLFVRLKYRFLPSAAQEFWAQELLEAQGLSAKLGQVLAQGKKAKLPKATYTLAAAKQLFEQQLHLPVELDGEVMAASMGQVFRARVAGRTVAIKVLHPQIKQKIKKEIGNILLLGQFYSKSKGFRFQRDNFQRFLEETFAQETDLLREAATQDSFYQLFQGDHRFRVPQVYFNFSTADILSQEYVTSTLAQDLLTVGNFHVFSFFFASLLKHGKLHGDLNDRNWGLQANGTVVIYDFGCAQTISPRRIEGLQKLLRNEDVVNGFNEFGVRLAATSFAGREQELRDALFAPLFDSLLTPDLQYSEFLKSKFGRDIQELREFTDPWVLLLMRSLFSLIRVYQRCGVTIPLQVLIAPYLHREEATMSTAKEIKVEVMEDKKLVVALTLPMTALDGLDTLMPERVSARMKEEKLDVRAIAARVRESNYAPQDLFKLVSGDRSYRVWIE